MLDTGKVSSSGQDLILKRFQSESIFLGLESIIVLTVICFVE